MTSFRTLIIVLLLALFTGVITQAPAQMAPARGETQLDWPQQESDLTPDPAVRYGRLANGLRYAIMPNQRPENAVSVRLRFNVGAMQEDEDQRGLAHFLEHMAFNGSEHVPEGEMPRMLERLGLRLGPDANASTSINETNFMFNAPRADAESLDTLFFLLREVSSRLTIAPEVVERERGVIMSEERRRNTPAYRAGQAQQRHFFSGARFIERQPIGDMEVVHTATARRIRDFYEANYRPERALLVIVGAVDPDAMEARIQTTFGDWRARGPAPAEPNLGAVTPPAMRAAIFVDPSLPTTLSITALRPITFSTGTAAQDRLSLIYNLGPGILTRRLRTLARSADAHFLGGSAASSRLFDTIRAAQISISSRPEDWRAALAVGETELRRALEHGFTQAEIDEELAGLRTGNRNAVEAAGSRPNAQLATNLLASFENWRVFLTPAARLEWFESVAPTITAADVSEAFRVQFAQEPMLFLTTSQAVDDAPAQILAAFEASRQNPVAPPAAVALAPFAYTNFGPPGAVAERRRVEDLDLTEVRFANNVRLNLKRTTFSRNAILVGMRVGGGTLELPNASLATLFSSLESGGLEAHSAEDLRRLQVGHTVGVNLSTQPGTFMFRGATNPADLAFELQLMAAYLTAPGYRPEGLAQLRRSFDTAYRNMASQPAGVASRDVPRLIRSGDPRFGMPPQAEMEAASYEDLRAALARTSRQAAIEISIVGDIDVERAIELVGATLGALPTRDRENAEFTAARRLTFPPGTPTPVVLRHTGDANRAMVQVYWPSIDDSNARPVRVQALLRAVLQAKLIERVREAEGRTYSPSAQNVHTRNFPGYGYLVVSLDLTPADVDHYFDVIDEIAADLAAGRISADEFERARRPALEAVNQSLQANTYWMEVIESAQSEPRMLDQHRTRRADYESITIEDLTTAARTYLRPDTAYRVAILPPSGASQ